MEESVEGGMPLIRVMVFVGWKWVTVLEEWGMGVWGTKFLMGGLKVLWEMAGTGTGSRHTPS